MKTQTAVLVFAISTLASLAGAINLALWPVLRCLKVLPRWPKWMDAYSLKNSNLDICILTIIYDIVLMLLLSVAACLKRSRKPRTGVNVTLLILTPLFQVRHHLLALNSWGKLIMACVDLQSHKISIVWRPQPSVKRDEEVLERRCGSTFEWRVPHFLQTALLAKAIVVALLGDDTVFPTVLPDGSCAVGVLLMYTTIVLSAATSVTQTNSCQSLMQG